MDNWNISIDVGSEVIRYLVDKVGYIDMSGG